MMCLLEKPRSEENGLLSFILEDTGIKKFQIRFRKKLSASFFFHSSFEQQKSEKNAKRGSDEAEADYSKPFLLFLLKCFMKKKLWRLLSLGRELFNEALKEKFKC